MTLIRNISTPPLKESIAITPSGNQGNIQTFAQKHLHIHGLKESVPLRTSLEKGLLNSQNDVHATLRQGQAKVSWMQGTAETKTEHLSGIYIRGGNRFDFETAFNKTLQCLTSQFGEGGYNLAYWTDEEGSLHSFIFPRDDSANENLDVLNRANIESACFLAL